MYKFIHCNVWGQIGHITHLTHLYFYLFQHETTLIPPFCYLPSLGDQRVWGFLCVSSMDVLCVCSRARPSIIRAAGTVHVWPRNLPWSWGTKLLAQIPLVGGVSRLLPERIHFPWGSSLCPWCFPITLAFATAPQTGHSHPSGCRVVSHLAQGQGQASREAGATARPVCGDCPGSVSTFHPRSH